MDASPDGDRRRTGRGGLPGPWTVLRAVLYRQLATDDDRAAYWIRHVHLGIVLSVVSGLTVAGYVLVSPVTPGRTVAILVLAGIAVIASPMLALLPLARIVRDTRGPLMFYAWSVADTVLITVAIRVDGEGSPLFVLLFLTLAFMAMAYPPAGGLLMGGLMTGGYLLGAAVPDVGATEGLTAAVMAVYTVLCALASANQWEAHDRQVLLLRTSEVLAATDPLTGCLNRRAFLDRLDSAAAGTGGPWVVCLVDLDGFKGVNDRSGHAAGDDVLRAVTTALGGVVRQTDTVARLGGDEFAVLAEATPEDSASLAARVRDAVAGAGADCGVTASVGVTEVRPGDQADEVLSRADQAMYRAKGAGGNRVTALAE
jgi:diguanylate cyclase (GGDEF)-like protein